MKYLDFGSIYLFSQINGMTPYDSIKRFQSGKDGLGAAPAIIYFNAESDKSQILSDNKGKAGIYQWTHLESNKIYIGSAAPRGGFILYPLRASHGKPRLCFKY
jgi:hypothetical protein